MNLKTRANKLRKDVLELALETKIPHLGSSYSIIEIMIALYDFVLKKEDRFILSKGHACYPLYILLRERGFKPTISGHPDIDVKNGICATTGSLGHGLPIGIGMAMAKRMSKRKGKVYVLLGDGECQEGSVWESLLIASHHKLTNLVIIIDYNKIQALDKVNKILSLGNLKSKFKSFGFDVSKIDGHDVRLMIKTLKLKTKKPHIIIANTIKGKGISYMENKPIWHNRMPNEKELKIAYEELK